MDIPLFIVQLEASAVPDTGFIFCLIRSLNALDRFVYKTTVVLFVIFEFAVVIADKNLALIS